jgi:hypothetical protein
LKNCPPIHNAQSMQAANNTTTINFFLTDMDRIV